MKRRKIKIKVLIILIVLSLGIIGSLNQRFLKEVLLAKNDSINWNRNDEKTKYIKQNQDKYPKDLLKALAKNEEMLNFVYDYLSLKGKVTSKDIGHAQKGIFPILLQYDQRWGYGLYGSEVMALTGCGPTVIAIAYAGLTGKNDLTPYDIAVYAEKNGYYAGGTTWLMMSEGIEAFGLKSKEIALEKNAIITELKKGHPIILSMRPGDFTSTGHFILLASFQNEMFTIRDPNSTKRSNKPWSYETLYPQIKNLWSIYLE